MNSELSAILNHFAFFSLSVTSVSAFTELNLTTVHVGSTSNLESKQEIFATKYFSPEKVYLQGITIPPCTRSAEYLLFPVMVHIIAPPFLGNMEHMVLIS